jgi:hypothetical protein
MPHLTSGNGGKVRSSLRGMGFLVGSDMQANGKLVMPFDIHGGSKFINCIRPDAILCRNHIAMLIMAAVFFPWEMGKWSKKS